jgi:PAS domain S-box-containing protein
MPNHFRRLFAPPIFVDEEKTRIASILNSFVWSAIGILSIIIIFRFVFWSENGYVPLLVLLTIVTVLAGGLIIIRHGHVRGASMFLVGALWLAMTYQAWEADGIRDAAVIAHIVVIIFSSLLLGWRFASVVGGLSVIVIWYFAIMEQKGLRVFHIDDPTSYARDLSVVIILIGVLIYLLISSWSRTLQSSRLELQERLRTEEKLQRQANYLAALNQTALGLLNRSELQPLLESILTRACDLLNTGHGMIDLVLPDGSALQQDVGYGVLSTYNGAQTLKNEGVTGNVWASGQQLTVQDYRTWNKSLPEFIDAGFKAVMGVPLKVGNEIIGVLAIAFVEQDRTFTQEQINLMERFAALASLAIDNARLYETAQKELQERRNTESALRSSEERFRKVFNNSYVAISIVTLEDGKFVEANSAFWELSGLQPEITLGHTSLELNIYNDLQGRDQFVQDMLEKRSLHNVQVEFKKENQPNKSAIAFFELIYIEDQLCILCMFFDVSEQRQAERALKENEERMRAILNSIPDMIFEISGNGTFLDFMASAELSPIMPPAQFIGKNIKEIFPAAIAEQTMFALGRALETDQVHAFEYGLPPGEETQFFEARISAIKSNSAMMMVRDISQRKWVETEREKLILELEEKNGELERFTYTVSHDLKSPLITIKGFLGFLEQDAASGNVVRLKADIQRIANAADKMQLLLSELLELTRIGRLMNPYQNINFEELAREAVELVHGQIQSKGIQVSIQGDLPLVYGDRQRLIEVIQNLIDNAAKFMGDQTNPRIEIGQNGYEDGKPIFYITDNGMGIDHIHYDRIFGLFNKLDANSEGTGIGLALVKRIIEVHGGRIWVQSEVKKGTTFFFTLQTEPAS